ncbi:MAG: hypothetical protein ABI904_10155 [Chloroflexota bacterium]
MSKVDIESIKEKQNKLNIQKQKLLQVFIPFRNAIINDLEEFFAMAVREELPGANRFRKNKDTSEIVEVFFNLNTTDLVLVSNDEVYNLDLDNQHLAGKMFIYHAGSDSNTPVVEIAFIETDDATYRFRMQWYSQTGIRPIDEGVVSTETTSVISSELVYHFYRFDFTWGEKPSMKAIHGKAGKRPIGFLANN